MLLFLLACMQIANLVSRKIPHTIFNDTIRICIFCKDPQRAYKDLVAHHRFPEDIRSKIGRVIGLDKLKKKYKSYESKRQLLAEYDVFMVDKRIIKIVADFLGKTFYGTKSRRPLPIDLTCGSKIDPKTNTAISPIGTSEMVGYEIRMALNSTYLSMSASTNTSIKVGRLSMTPQQLKENIESVTKSVITRFVARQWRNIRRLEIKGPTTKALPIWVFDEMWMDEAQVLEEEPKFAIGHTPEEKAYRKRRWDEWAKEIMEEEEFDNYMNNLMKRRNAPSKKRRSKASKEAGSISREKRRKLKQDALEDVPKSVVPQ
ncbi:ribosomal protein L1 [Periconia macrospinosa]|uniref:Ribosomal protein L1 n=1 Tax=Periconia macrospinosa TaxID=97972 RepID=A0A2V1DUB3_9PLEO|nr:ribosomal protein L1 [Periconia macrospinosa]